MPTSPYMLEYLEQLLLLMPCHIYWKDREGKILGCNRLQAESLGLASPEDIIGKTDYDFLSYEDATKVRQTDLEIITTGKTCVVEESVSIAGNKYKTFLSQKLPLKNPRGEIIGIAGISLDITIQKEAEQREKIAIAAAIEAKARLEVQESLEHLENILAVMPGHVYWKNKEGVYLGCNIAQAVNFGFSSPAEFIGKTDSDLVDEKLVAEFKKIDADILKTGKTYTLEESGMLPNGKLATFLSQKMPLKNRRGEITGIMGISIDITAQKEAEKQAAETLTQLRATEEARKTMQTLGASIAHEMRTPLAAVSTNLKTIKKLSEKWMAETAASPSARDLDLLKTLVENATKQTDSAQLVINMLLQKIHPTVNRSDFSKNSIQKCILEAIELYPFNDEEKALVSFHSTQDFEFLGNAAMIAHVFFNLFKNALYAIHEVNRGNITIEIEAPTSEYHVVCIRDTGKGIDPQECEKIFSGFYSKTHGGTGVGLAFCKMVMESMDGKITCTGIPGKLTEFRLFFPSHI